MWKKKEKDWDALKNEKDHCPKCGFFEKSQLRKVVTDNTRRLIALVNLVFCIVQMSCSIFSHLLWSDEPEFMKANYISTIILIVVNAIGIVLAAKVIALWKVAHIYTIICNAFILGFVQLANVLGVIIFFAIVGSSSGIDQLILPHLCLASVVIVEVIFNVILGTLLLILNYREEHCCKCAVDSAVLRSEKNLSKVKPSFGRTIEISPIGTPKTPETKKSSEDLRSNSADKSDEKLGKSVPKGSPSTEGASSKDTTAGVRLKKGLKASAEDYETLETEAPHNVVMEDGYEAMGPVEAAEEKEKTIYEMEKSAELAGTDLTAYSKSDYRLPKLPEGICKTKIKARAIKSNRKKETSFKEQKSQDETERVVSTKKKVDSKKKPSKENLA